MRANVENLVDVELCGYLVYRTYFNLGWTVNAMEVDGEQFAGPIVR